MDIKVRDESIEDLQECYEFYINLSKDEPQSEEKCRYYKERSRQIQAICTLYKQHQKLLEKQQSENREWEICHKITLYRPDILVNELDADIDDYPMPECCAKAFLKEESESELDYTGERTRLYCTGEGVRANLNRLFLAKESTKKFVSGQLVEKSYRFYDLSFDPKYHERDSLDNIDIIHKYDQAGTPQNILWNINRNGQKFTYEIADHSQSLAKREWVAYKAGNTEEFECVNPFDNFSKCQEFELVN